MKAVILVAVACSVVRVLPFLTSKPAAVGLQAHERQISLLSLNDESQSHLFRYRPAILDTWRTLVDGVPGCQDLVELNVTAALVDQLPPSSVLAIRELYFHLGHKLPQAVATRQCSLVREVIDRITIALVDARHQVESLRRVFQSLNVSQISEQARVNVSRNLSHLAWALFWDFFDFSWGLVPNMTPWVRKHWECDTSVIGQVRKCVSAIDGVESALHIHEQDLEMAAQSFQHLGIMLNEFIDMWPQPASEDDDDQWCDKQMIVARTLCSDILELFAIEGEAAAFEKCMKM